MFLKEFFLKIYYRKLRNNTKHAIETANVNPKLTDEVIEHVKKIRK